MNKHTPGPWHAEKSSGRFEIWPKDNRQGHCYVGVIQRDEDACLIAAAPELLEACENLLTYAQKLLEASGGIDGLIVSRSGAEYDIEQARPAISKAGGEA